MMHVSLPADDAIEVIEMSAEQFSPLISKVKVKVCYVGDEPNRNKTVITKDLAKKLAPSLRGSAVVGRYNLDEADFEQHNKELQVHGEKFEIVDLTKPYGFVDLNAPVWFQKFIDDNQVEREYLCTEAYLWTSAYPEAQRIVDKGNNQSLEFSSENFSGVWANQDNSNARFFIINEAIIEKLCILGENYEPCFEGAQIRTEFSLDNQFAEMRQTMYSMVADLHKVLQEGGTVVPTEYAVEIGCSLFDAICETLWAKDYSYSLKGIFKEGEQLFAVAQNRNDLKLYRLDFQYDDANGFVPSSDLVEVTETFSGPATQYSEEDIAAFETQYKAKKDEEEKPEDKADDEEEKKLVTENALQEEPVVEPVEPEVIEEPAPASAYSLDDVVEYQELLTKYSDLEAQLNSLQEELNILREFKLNSDRKEKQAMIDKFYMLSDESKKDVIDHIDTYSLDDIEAKLSVICVRNKVSFVDESEDVVPTAYNLNSASDGIEEEWIRAVKAKEKSLN